MAAKLSDAKITVRLDTEAADEKLTKIEGKLKKDEKAIKAVEKKQKGKGQAGFLGGAKKRGKSVAKASMAGGVSGGITGVLNLIPFKDEIGAAISIVEHVNPMLIGFMDELKASIPDIPIFKEFSDNLIELEQKKLKAISQTIKEVKVKLEAIDYAQKSASDLVRTATGLGVPVDAGFIMEHTATMLEIGTVKARLAKTIRDVSHRNLGSSVAKTFKTFMGS